jgi:DNA-binding MarR family transcriptional regulator
MLRRLQSQEYSVGELADHYDLTFAGVSKHLQVLERATLIRKRRNGREQRISLSPRGLKSADKYLAQYRALWEGRMDRLGNYLQDSI